MRSSQVETAAAGASMSASLSEEVSARQMTLPEPDFVGQTRTSPWPHGRNTPSTSSSRANDQRTGAAEPMGKLMWTAYGSDDRYGSLDGTGTLFSGDSTSRSSSSRSTTVRMVWHLSCRTSRRSDGPAGGERAKRGRSYATSADFLPSFDKSLKAERG
ncbi:hypothetical protein AA958_10790 [Streptomyces sp. CNQ-509]|nr:hypothetical protein AA958_10790 [Streptomyces sp. CNQ-509]